MKVKLKETREKDAANLGHELADLEKHLFELRSQAVTEKLEDPSQLGKTRKQIARIKTIVRERELQSAAPSDTDSKAAAAK